MRLFDVLGPVMTGPSSSHTAGAVRIGLTARNLLGEAPKTAEILLHGSFAATGRGHGTDRALVAGLLGMICDGAKEGCASKVALSAGLAVEAAYLAMEGTGVSPRDGILDDKFEDLIAHLGQLVCEGMSCTNQTIVRIMKDEKGPA